MFSKLRNYSKIVIIIIALAMVITGGLMGYGAYMNRSTPTNQQVNSPYVAKVNDTNITQEEFYTILRNQASQTSQLTSSQIVPFKLSILNSMIERQLILQKAEEMGLKAKVTDQDVEDYIQKILEANDMTKDELINNLKQQGIKYADLQDDLRNSLKEQNLIEQVQEKSYSNVSVSEDEIKRSYEKVKPLLIVKEFKNDKDAAEKQIKEALGKINEGNSFAKVSEDYSDRSSDIGFIGHDSSLPEDVVNKAFALEQGEISDVITGTDAFYVLKVEDKKVAEGKDYQDAKSDIKDSLLQDKQNKAFNNWLENARAESNVVINDPTLAGYNALRKGNYEQAVNKLQIALEVNPVPSTYTYLAQAYYGNENQEKAVAIYDQAVEKFPDDWQLHYNYGNFLAGLKNADQTDKDKAIVQYDKAAELAGSDFMAHYQLYMAYSNIGAAEKAQAEMDKLNELQQQMQKQQEERQKAQQSETNKTAQPDTQTKTDDSAKSSTLNENAEQTDRVDANGSNK